MISLFFFQEKMRFVGFLFCFCCIIVIRSSLVEWEYVRSADVDKCFGKQTLCGCNIGEAIVSFGIDENCQNAYPHGIGCINHLNCSKPIDMSEDECVLVDISTQFNSNGSVLCPDNYFLQCMYRYMLFVGHILNLVFLCRELYSIILEWETK